MQDGLDESFNSCMAPVDVALSNRRVCGRRAMHALSLGHLDSLRCGRG
jgi:hypothetical protein